MYSACKKYIYIMTNDKNTYWALKPYSQSLSQQM